MTLITFSGGKVGHIVLSDDADEKDIYNAMYIDATSTQGNGGRILNRTEDQDDKRS